MEPPSELDGLEPIFTKTQVAKWGECTERNIDLQVLAGQFPAPIRLGAYPRWPRSFLLNWLEAQSPKTGPIRQPSITAMESQNLPNKQ